MWNWFIRIDVNCYEVVIYRILSIRIHPFCILFDCVVKTNTFEKKKKKYISTKKQSKTILLTLRF